MVVDGTNECGIVIVGVGNSMVGEGIGVVVSVCGTGTLEAGVSVGARGADVAPWSAAMPGKEHANVNKNKLAKAKDFDLIVFIKIIWTARSVCQRKGRHNRDPMGDAYRRERFLRFRQMRARNHRGRCVLHVCLDLHVRHLHHMDKEH